jgi:hypothetical protein
MLKTINPSRLNRLLVELDEVHLARSVSKDGIVYPVGTRGVIVWCHPDGLAFEVEFPSPEPAVVTVLGQDLL